MTATDHEVWGDLLPAYALGSLDADEAAAVTRHLESCAACRAELAVWRQVTDALALAAPAAAPSPALRRRLLAEAAAMRPAPAPTADRRRPTGATRPLTARRAWPVMAVVALAAVVLGGLLWAAVGNLSLFDRAVALLPAEVAPEASGELRFPRRGEATLEVWDLPPLPPDQQYQLWLVAGDARDSGAVFAVNASGWARVPVAVSRPAADYDAFGITIEPAGGSPGPTGERVLGSQQSAPADG
jgi:anti-sigma-K factor RskA